MQDSMPQTGSAREPRIISINSRLKNQSEKLATLVARLGSFRSRMVGPTPSAVSPEQPSPPRGDGMLDVAEDLLSELTMTVTEFEDIVSHLEGVC